MIEEGENLDWNLQVELKNTRDDFILVFFMSKIKA